MVIGICYLVEMFIAAVAWRSLAVHSMIPQLPNADAGTIAVGMIRATVMLTCHLLAFRPDAGGAASVFLISRWPPAFRARSLGQ